MHINFRTMSINKRLIAWLVLTAATTTVAILPIYALIYGKKK
jgi:hypothetical protein